MFRPTPTDRPAPLPVFLLALAAAVGCGTSGPSETAPIEAAFFVSAPSGTTFRVVAEPRPDCSDRFGIESTRERHVFGDRLFEAPHLFVLENARQPVAATFEAVGGTLTVYLFLGPELFRSVQIEAGNCGTIETGAPSPPPTAREVRLEIRAEGEMGERVDVPFEAFVGDDNATYVTTCVLLPVVPSCQTPATFFLEGAEGSVTAEFRKLLEERTSTLELEAFANDVLRARDRGDAQVRASFDL